MLGEPLLTTIISQNAIRGDLSDWMANDSDSQRSIAGRAVSASRRYAVVISFDLINECRKAGAVLFSGDKNRFKQSDSSAENDGHISSLSFL